MVTCDLTATQQYFTFATDNYSNKFLPDGGDLWHYSFTVMLHPQNWHLHLAFPSSAASPVHLCVNDQGNQTALKYSVSELSWAWYPLIIV